MFLEIKEIVLDYIVFMSIHLVMICSLWAKSLSILTYIPTLCMCIADILRDFKILNNIQKYKTSNIKKAKSATIVI